MNASKDHANMNIEEMNIPAATKEKLYSHFLTSTELLRHFWGCFPIIGGDADREMRIAASISKLLDQVKSIRDKSVIIYTISNIIISYTPSLLNILLTKDIVYQLKCEDKCIIHFWVYVILWRKLWRKIRNTTRVLPRQRRGNYKSFTVRSLFSDSKDGKPFYSLPVQAKDEEIIELSLIVLN